jgi:hypothetical protein
LTLTASAESLQKDMLNELLIASVLTFCSHHGAPLTSTAAAKLSVQLIGAQTLSAAAAAAAATTLTRCLALVTAMMPYSAPWYDRTQLHHCCDFYIIMLWIGR